MRREDRDLQHGRGPQVPGSLLHKISKAGWRRAGQAGRPDHAAMKRVQLIGIALFLPLTLRAQPEATIHQEYDYQLPKPALTWTPVQGLPSGLRIIPEDARVWGAPNEAGQYKFALRASDGTQITLDLKVNALWN